MDDKQQACVEAYSHIKNLKLVGIELGIPWQSVYVYLKRAGVAVTGDKARYGSEKDRFAARAEKEFQRLVPAASDQNHVTFQAKVDFLVGLLGVDVKASLAHFGRADSQRRRWAFSMKKQERIADFVVCFAFHNDTTYAVFLLPGEVIRNYQTISIPLSGNSKWLDYKIEPVELAPFFNSVMTVLAA